MINLLFNILYIYLKCLNKYSNFDPQIFLDNFLVDEIIDLRLGWIREAQQEISYETCLE